MIRLPTKAKLMAWVEDYAERMDLDAARTLFLTKFASWAGIDFESAVKVETLTRQCRCSERMLQKMRAEFVAQGVLVATGRLYTLEETGRGIPLYRWALFLDEFNGVASGAHRAPEGEAGVHGNAASGAQGVHPHIEPIEPTTSSEVDARALREALFVRLEKAVPKACLGNSDRDRARGHFGALLDEGEDGEAIIAAAASWTADAKARRKDVGLHYWLYDRRFRQYLDDDGPARQGAPAVRAVFDPPAEVLAVIVREKGAAFITTWLSQATYDGGVIRCRLGIQADTVRNAVGRHLEPLGVRVEGPSPSNRGTS